MSDASDPGGSAFSPEGTWFEHSRSAEWKHAAPSRQTLDFHRSLDRYAATPLMDLPALARDLNVGRVVAKDESSRLGLPAFKALGASWAIERILRTHAETSGTTTIVTATDGNHGRAVAHFARHFGHRSLIFIPDGVHPSAVQAIQDEGADVREVGGSYDDAVSAAASAATAPGHVLVQDTAWEGYEQIPGWIVDGYATLFAEADEQLTALTAGSASVDLVLVPTGVGSLLQAALTHYRSAGDARVVSVEPTEAACIVPSIDAGEPVTVETGVTVMSGLNCGTPSLLAWPLIRDGLDGAVSIDDSPAVTAAWDLADLDVPTGPCGGSGLAAARFLLTGPGSRERRKHLRVDETSTVLLIITEGSAANPLPERPRPT
ncbi:MAG: diaminopropionate ammonia-lyase [Candidatus Nanopelagicales bacterium]